MTLLQIKTSIFGDAGQSSRLADAFVENRRAAEPGSRVIVRDLARDPVPHLTGARFGAFVAAPEARTTTQQAVVAQSDALIDELKAADTIVLGLPMYNFGVPSTLKAYFDHVARAGVTFRYSDRGSVGLLTGKKAYVFATRGGLYAGTSRDLQTAYVRDFLAFLGVTDVEFIYAEGLAIGDASRQASLARAASEIERIAAPDAVAA